MIRMALLGCGDVATRDYLPEWHRLAGRAEIVAVCGRGEARARAVAAEYGIPAVYTDYERMLAETDAEAVVNLTPIQLHAETTLAALSAGKHVYSEKPVAGSVWDAERIAAAARERGLTLVCAPCVMRFPQVRRAREIVQSGAIGAVFAARGHGMGGVPPWGGYPSDPSPFFAHGGGPLWDMGVYPLHALTGLLGPVRRVSAFSSRTRSSFTIGDGPFRGKEVPIEAPDNWRLLLDFGDSRLATVDANNCVVGTRGPDLELFGDRGSLAVNLLDVSAPVLQLRPGRGWEEIAIPRSGRERGPDHLLGIEHLIDCIRDGTPPELGIEHALHVVEVIEKAGRSAEEGRTEEIVSRFPSAIEREPTRRR